MVLENRNVTGKTTLYQLFFDKQVMTFSGEIYRPLRDISYRVDYMIGGKEPFVYHATNILLHVITTLTVYWFLILFSKDGQVPLLAAAIFAVHPLHTESVAWVKGRDDILFALFYLLSFVMYLKYDYITGWKGRFYLLASISLFILSLFSKELAVTLPLAIALYQMIFNRFKFSVLLPYFAISTIYMGLRTYVLEQVAQQEEYWGGSFLTTMLTMTKGIAHYVRLSFLPINQCADYLFPLASAVDTWVMLYLSIFSICFALLILWGDRHVLWGGVFFFVSLLPVLNIIPIKIIIAERFLYLPLLGFSIVFATGLCAVFPPGKRFWVISGALICFFALLTFQRNHVWSDEYSLWSDTIRKSPSNPRAHYGLGTAYASQGKMDEAIREYKESIRLAPYYPYAFYGLGLVYDRKGMTKEAIALYRNALRSDPTHRDARYNLALLYNEKGMPEEAIKEYNEILKYDPNDFDALNALGLAYFQKGLFEDALLQYNKALNIDPESVTPYNNTAMVYAVMGKKMEAEKWFKMAIEKDPKSAETYYNLGVLHQGAGSVDKAAEAYKRALNIKPDYKEAEERLGEIESKR